MGEEARVLKGEKLDLGRECLVGTNIQNQSKSISDNTIK